MEPTIAEIKELLEIARRYGVKSLQKGTFSVVLDHEKASFLPLVGQPDPQNNPQNNPQAVDSFGEFGKCGKCSTVKIASDYGPNGYCPMCAADRKWKNRNGNRNSY